MLGPFPTLAAAKAKAASVAPPKAPAPADATTAQDAAKLGRPAGVKHNKLLGFSACVVAKALGRVGVKFDEADRIMKAHGVTMTKPSLGVQLGFGRNPSSWERHGKPASLTDEQLAVHGGDGRPCGERGVGFESAHIPPSAGGRPRCRGGRGVCCRFLPIAPCWCRRSARPARVALWGRWANRTCGRQFFYKSGTPH